MILLKFTIRRFFSVLRLQPKCFIFLTEMSKFKKILTILLALIYIAHVYSRLVHTPPIYIHAALGSTRKTIEINSEKKHVSFILHRRHLPLVKKIELGKLYPSLLQEKSFLIYSQKPIVVSFFSLIHTDSSDLTSFPNKAPPIFDLI